MPTLRRPRKHDGFMALLVNWQPCYQWSRWTNVSYCTHKAKCACSWWSLFHAFMLKCSFFNSVKSGKESKNQTEIAVMGSCSAPPYECSVISHILWLSGCDSGSGPVPAFCDLVPVCVRASRCLCHYMPFIKSQRWQSHPVSPAVYWLSLQPTSWPSHPCFTASLYVRSLQVPLTSRLLANWQAAYSPNCQRRKPNNVKQNDCPKCQEMVIWTAARPTQWP